MKVGKSLTELAAELQRQAESKRDYLADTRAIRLEPALEAAAPVILHGVNGGLALRPTAHAQLASAPKTAYVLLIEGSDRAPAINYLRQVARELRVVVADRSERLPAAVRPNREPRELGWPIS